MLRDIQNLIQIPLIKLINYTNSNNYISSHVPAAAVEGLAVDVPAAVEEGHAAVKGPSAVLGSDRPTKLHPTSETLHYNTGKLL